MGFNGLGVASVYSAAYKRLLERLRASRLAAGLTQAQVARAFGRPQSFISKCESGERRIDAVELARFAALYGLPLEHFVGAPASDGAGMAAEGAPATRKPARRRAGDRSPSRR